MGIVKIVTRLGSDNTIISVKYVDLSKAIPVKRISLSQLAALQSKGLTVVIV
jgi:hypothetical protein